MKSILLLAAIALALALTAAKPSAPKYTDKYDHVDVEMILKNDRILTSYVKCALDEGPCTAEGRELKADLPDALESDCARCSPRQKQIVAKAARHLRANRPRDWERLTNKYDPEHKYQQQFERFLSQA